METTRAPRRTSGACERELAGAERAGRRGRSRSAVVASLLLAIALLGAGCDGAGDGSPAAEGEATERIASTERFRGDRREIAAAIEAYEAAVRAGEATTLCRRVLRPGRGRGSRKAIAECIGDPDNPARGDRAEREALDLAVRRIALLPRRPRDLRGVPARLPDHEVEWSLRETPRAVALVDSVASGGSLRAFGLDRHRGKWRVTAYWRSHEVEPPQEALREFLRREGVIGFYGIAGPEQPRCRGAQAGIIWDAAPVKAANARESIVNGFLTGDGVRRALESGATLIESDVRYPGPERTFVLRSPSDRPVATVSIAGAGPDYRQDGIEGCRSWVRRLSRG